MKPSERFALFVVTVLAPEFVLSGCSETQPTPIKTPVAPPPAPVKISKKIQLKAIGTRAGKIIPKRLLSEQEERYFEWPTTSFVLFYKKGFKSGGMIGEPNLVVHRAWYKPLPSSSWSEAPKSLIDKCEFNIVLSGGGESQISGNVVGFAFDPPPPGLWRLDAEAIVTFMPDAFSVPLDAPTPQYEGHARFTALLTAPQSTLLGNPVELHPSWIAHIEWAPTLKGPWKKVPEPGQTGFPLHVKQPLNIYLRAAKRYPREPWPTEGYDAINNGQRLPSWSGSYWNTRIERDVLAHAGDDILSLQKSALNWQNFDQIAKGTGTVGSDNNHLLTITARAGSDKSAHLFIEPLPATP